MIAIHNEEIAAQKMNHIEALIEQIILDTIIAASCRILENREKASENICYRSNCTMRDSIPF